MERVKVADLNMYIKLPIVRGIIIHSQNLVFCEKTPNCDTVWAFTLRDSTKDTINIKYWGNKPNIKKIYNNFHVGDVVEIRCAKIYCRQYGHESEKHYPLVTSNYLLWCKDGHTVIWRCTPEESKEYTHLLHTPCEDIYSCMPLENVLEAGKSIHRSYLNFFVIILSVSRKQILFSTDLNKVIFRKKLIVTDRTLAQYQILLWDDENIYRSRNWIPRKTVLFIVEAHILWSNRENCINIVLDKKTIITENPTIPETELLRDFFSIPEDNDLSSPDLSTCNLNLPNTTDNVLALPAEPSMTDDLLLVADVSDEPVLMTVQELLSNTEAKPLAGFYTRPRPFEVNLHCYILDRNLDTPKDILSFTCNECKEIASPYGCYDYRCTGTGNISEPSSLQPHFECIMQLADRTGTLQNCRISEQTAQDILGSSAEGFLARPKMEIYNLKWFFTINQFEAKLLITPIVCGPPHIQIISLKKL